MKQEIKKLKEEYKEKKQSVSSIKEYAQIRKDYKVMKNKLKKVNKIIKTNKLDEPFDWDKFDIPELETYVKNDSIDNFDKACKRAYKFYKSYGYKGLSEICDIGEKWLFYPNRNKMVFGEPDITIDKKTLEIKYFVLPDEENFKLLDNKIEIEVPNKYK